MSRLGFLFCFCFTLAVGFAANAQVLNPDGSVLDQNDPIVEFGPTEVYNESNLPPKPQWGYVGKWIRTKQLSWNTDSYKAYIYKDLRFRIKFPRGYNSNRTEKYPVIVMLHGMGETGGLYDNENQLKNGGKKHSDAVDQGAWDGFLVFPQTFGGWPDEDLDKIKEVVEFMAKHKNVDINRVNLHGLSMGGGGTWSFVLRHPQFMASALPMSGTVADRELTQMDKFKYMPVWISQGGKDNNPTPGSTTKAVEQLLAAGANVRYSLYESLGHGVWNTHYNEPDFFTYMTRANKANPWPLFGRTEFCPEDAIRVTLGLSPGFTAYQWRKNGIVIEGAVSNTYIATSVGIYEARVKRGTEWSYWSPRPVEVKIKAPTVTPPIQIAGKASWFIPSPAGNSVTLALPEGFEKYTWKKVGNDAVIGSERTLTVTQPGEYIASVSEKFGCSSNYSAPFLVKNSAGINAPDPVNGLTASVVSKTEISLGWSDNPHAKYNETGFEVYRSAKSGGPYSFVHLTGSDVKTFTDSGLLPGTEYYYVIRPINEFSAGSVSVEVKGKTLEDIVSPYAPINLQAEEVTQNSVKLIWSQAKDDVGVVKYEVYKNGALVMPVTDTTATIYNLLAKQVYNFTVRAIDFSGNKSVASNQLTIATVNTGLSYAEYHGSWDKLPDFTTLSPVKTGRIENFLLDPKSQSDNFAFTFDGFINTPATGTYTFYTTSDDGSKLYINGKEVVNNDGLHGAQERSGVISLTAGIHAIRVAFFERTSGERLEVRWQGPGISKQLIPSSALKDDFAMPGNPPAFPTNLVAKAVSYNQIDLQWKDNSLNETGFQIYRSSTIAGPFYPIAVVDSGVVAYNDKGLSAATTYYYKVMALGKYGVSGFSNEIKGGLNYKYFEKGFNNLTQLETAIPAKVGQSTNIDLTPRNRSTNIAFIWEGKIHLEKAGQYTFYTESDDGSKLWINGTEVVKNDYDQGMTERSGTWTVTTPGTFNIKVAWRQKTGSYGLNVRYEGPGVPKQLIPDAAFSALHVNAKTNALPPAPVAPLNFTAKAVSGTEVHLNWSDGSTNEEGFEVYRSMSSAGEYLLLDKLPANSTSFVNKNLFPNVSYYYKVAAAGVGGKSESPAVLARTLNSLPVLNPISSRTIKNGSSLKLEVTAVDPDNEELIFSHANLPSFAELNISGNGIAELEFNPAIENIGMYGGIAIMVNDQNGGADTVFFDLVVNDNDLPVLNIPDVFTVDEGKNSTVQLSASDANVNDELQWEVENLPYFASLVVANRTATLSVSPGFTDAGNYEVTIRLKDGNGGDAERNFNIKVNEVDPIERVFINITGGTNGSSPWNNVKGLNSGDLLNQKGDNSGIGISFLTSWWSTYTDGAVTGSNSGVYPDAVLREYYYFGIFGGPETVDVKVTGLDPSMKYNFTFMASSRWGNVSDNGSTVFTIGNESKSLHVQNNSSNTVTISSIVPDSSGEVIFKMAKAANTPVGYLNALVIESAPDSGNPPAVVRGVTAGFNSGAIELTWENTPFNEDGFNIYKSILPSEGFTKIGSVGANTLTFNDREIKSNSTYYYRISSFNQYGESAGSDTVIALTPAIPPVIVVDSVLIAEAGKTSSVTIKTMGAPTTGVNLSVSSVPSFVHFTDNGDGTGTLVVTPSAEDIGIYSGIQVLATNMDGTSTNSLVLEVTARKLYSINVNLTQNSYAASPWNNIRGSVSTDLLNEAGINSGIDLNFQTSWWAVYNEGAVTGNDSGVFPDNVIKEYYYFGIHGGPEVVEIKVSGLDPTKLYNFTFFASSKWAGVADNGSTVFAIGDQSKALHVQNNNKNIVKLVDIVPDVNGDLIIRMSKAPNTPVGYLNGFTIDAFDNPTIEEGPVATALKAYGVSANQIELSWTPAKTAVGYELYRAGSASGTYTRIFSGNSGVSSYINGGLTKGSSYYYKLKTIYSNGSAETKPVFGATLQYVVYINMNGKKVYDAPSPWNNFGILPINGDAFGGFRNEEGNENGIVLEFADSFTGDNDWGMNTGNNSGIFPDNVLKSFFFMENLDHAKIIVKGLDQTMGYNFGFFSSINLSDVLTTFTIGDKSVVANPSYNTSRVEKINGVNPDINSEIVIEVTSNARWSIWNALVIQAYPNGKGSLNARSGGTTKKVTYNKSVYQGKNSALSLKELEVYPNPFQEVVTIRYPELSSEKVEIYLLSLTGEIILQEEVELSGDSHSLDLSAAQLPAGVYLLKVKSGTGTKMVKILKN